MWRGEMLVTCPSCSGNDADNKTHLFGESYGFPITTTTATTTTAARPIEAANYIIPFLLAPLHWKARCLKSLQHLRCGPLEATTSEVDNACALPGEGHRRVWQAAIEAEELLLDVHSASRDDHARLQCPLPSDRVGDLHLDIVGAVHDPKLALLVVAESNDQAQTAIVCVHQSPAGAV